MRDNSLSMKLKGLPGKTFLRLVDLVRGKGLNKIPFFVTVYNKLTCSLRPKGKFVIPVRGFNMTVIYDEMGVSLLEKGYWEKAETELFESLLTTGMTVVDIGAHIGYYTLIGAKLVGDNGRVYAFEPQPDNYNILCENIKLNGLSGMVEAVNKAVCDKTGILKFWICEEDSINSSLVESNVIFKKRSIEIETVSLDEYLKGITGRIDFLKVDVGGNEGQILRGASRLLSEKKIKTIFLEYWPEGLKNAGENYIELLTNLHKYSYKLIFARDIRDQANLPMEIDGSMAIPEFSRVVTDNSIFNLVFTLE